MRKAQIVTKGGSLDFLPGVPTPLAELPRSSFFSQVAAQLRV
jgi:hypothetical protein